MRIWVDSYRINGYSTIVRWFLLFLLLILTTVAVSCGAVQSSPQDGGSITKNGQELYWTGDDFPLWLLIDDQLPPMHAQATIEAALLWNAEVGDQVFEPLLYDFSRSAPNDHGLVVVSMRELGQTDRDTRRLGMARAVTREGTHHMRASQVWFDTDLDDSVLLVVMLHELGHALTLDHDNDCGSIMHPTVVSCEGSVQMTPEDIHRIRSMMDGTRALGPQVRMEFLPEVWRDTCTH